MNNYIQEYIQVIENKKQQQESREHAYRPALEILLKTLLPHLTIINDPAQQEGNAPDFLIKKDEIPVGYIECKDVGIVLDSSEVQKQAKRYLDAFDSLILTNYEEFRFYKYEEQYAKIILNKEADDAQKTQFSDLIKDFATPSPRSIKSSKRLAQIMAHKSRIMRDIVLDIVKSSDEGDIQDQYEAFKKVLIHDLSEKEFADMYAQTLTYGLFVARYFDESLESFSRHEAQDLLPHSNPLLRNFFGHVAGVNFEPRLAWIIDDLVSTYNATDVHGLMHKEFETKSKDPVLHFYETYLAEYDPKLRKSRGVYYTPEPVVSFIVRSVDQILKDKFNLKDGLKDTTKVSWDFKIQETDKRYKDNVKRASKEIHKVQILDPAVGTGTFLNSIILEIYKQFKGQEGQWPSYVSEHLLPRLHGFELMMASYTMAHLKLGITLRESGFEGKDERISVFLTNSLEKGVKEVPNLFMSQWLTKESEEASRVKNELPIMVIVGNPPYSVSSSNKGEWINEKMDVYKKDLYERNIQPLSDDYIKFIRFAEHQIEQTGYGIVAMITNNSFYDGIIHRQMRKHLLQTFDEIYALNLHGNSKRKETTSEGGKDENVFDIQQGVGISLFIKSRNDKDLADLFVEDLYGLRKEKYDKLSKKSFSDIEWKQINPKDPYYFFVEKDFELQEEYNEGIKLDELFNVQSSGVTTHRDYFVIDFDKTELKRRIAEFANLENSDAEIKEKYSLKNTSSFNLTEARIAVSKETLEENIQRISYRPFDTRWIYYSTEVIDRDRLKVMQHMLEQNIAFIVSRQQRVGYFKHIFAVNSLAERTTVSSRTGEVGYCMPLYIYSSEDTLYNQKPILNLDTNEINKICSILNMKMDHTAISADSKTSNKQDIFTGLDLFNYIYAVLYSPTYREKYKEFLKIDFPRIPFDVSKEQFWKLVELGSELRKFHLLEHEKLNDLITTFPISGDNEVKNGYPVYENNKVYINTEQYFGDVPESAWEFWIGGYQPSQKWLKDRRGRKLSSDDINHYQKMIVSLTETEKIMEKIDKVLYGLIPT